MKPDKKHIPLSLYKKIVDSIPIVGTDLIVEYKGGILLIKRLEEPNKGAWWFPGGRVLKYESPKNAALRILNKETGLAGRVKKLVGIYTTNFERWSGINHFSIHIVYHIIAKGVVKLDKTSSEYRIVKGIENHMHPYMKRALRDSHIFG